MITLVEPSIAVIPTFNRVLYSISSDNAALDGFKYVVKVLNQVDEVLATLYFDTPPNENEAVEFDVSKIVSTYYDYSKGINETSTFFNKDRVFSFKLNCYEYYVVDGAGVIVLDTLVVSELKYGLPVALPLLEKRDWYNNITDYTGNISTWKPLTDWFNIKMRLNDTHIFQFYYNDDVNPIQVDAQFFYEDGTNEVLTYSITPSATHNQIMYYVFNRIDYTYRLDITLVKLSIVYLEESVYEFANISFQECGKVEPTRVAYLNKYGAYDFMNFDLISKDSFDIEKKGYQKEYTGDIFVGDIVKNLNPMYYVKESQKVHLISDYLSDAQSLLLRDMYSSPLVYINRDGNWVPVKITQGTYEVKKIIADKLFNVEIDVELQLPNLKQSI